MRKTQNPSDRTQELHIKKKKKGELEGTEQNVNIVNVLIERGEKEKKK